MKKAITIIFLATALLFCTKASCQEFEMYISDGGNFNNPPWKILKADGNGDSVEIFTTEELGWPQDIVILEDQNIILVSNLNTGKITKYNIADGTYLGDFATGISGPTRMKIGADSLLYVLQWQGDGKVKRYELDGTFVDDFTSSGVNQSIGIDWDSEGKLYVSSWGGAKVETFDDMGNSLGDFISSNLQGPTNIWFDDAGELLVANWSGTTVKRFDADGNYMEDFITGLSNPEGVDFFPNGNILIGNGGTSAVKLFDADGNFIEDIIPSGTLGLILPNAVRLREIPTPVSVTDINTAINFIQPTIGSAFYLSPGLPQNIESITVYNAQGLLIERKRLTDSQGWIPSHHPDGIYIIVGKSREGNIFSQKVFLKR